MRTIYSSCLGMLAGALSLASLRADERRFTYVYEPETLPQGAIEFENWVTLRAGKSSEVGKDDFNRWDLRQELEYGVTDWYTAALYLNEKAESYRDPATDAHESEFEWKGISLENRFNVLNPAAHTIGVTLYLEGRYSGEEAAIEQKIILGQRHGNWKWAFNLEHETEWEEDLSEVEGKVGASAGLARDLGSNWALGVEFRNENVLPEYEKWENSALYLGPVLSYRQERFWAALTVMPQIYGWNNSQSQDGNSNLDLDGHERIQVRLLFGIQF
ncbi:MAG: hypothetical protein JNK85_24800 [Verrucomicrobiales bacterium]|nr:hypothetical protein [Verrucomicrobiales bacterium]